jgi:hypothetical protein
MKKFVLKDLYGKPLLAVESDHYDKAVKYFSIIKKLEVSSLLSTFKVVEVVI